jgi:hypothetical protein
MGHSLYQVTSLDGAYCVVDFAWVATCDNTQGDSQESLQYSQIVVRVIMPTQAALNYPQFVGHVLHEFFVDLSHVRPTYGVAANHGNYRW